MHIPKGELRQGLDQKGQAWHGPAGAEPKALSISWTIVRMVPSNRLKFVLVEEVCVALVRAWRTPGHRDR